MTKVDKNLIFNSLTKYIHNEWYGKASKKNPEFANAVKEITISDVEIGDPPTLRCGYVEGSSTGVGKSQQGDTVYTRTVSVSFDTEEYFFAEKRDVTLANYALRVFGARTECHTPSEAASLAEKCGRTHCRNDLSDLNYSMTEYRLNRYKLIYTGDEFTPDVYPVYANINHTNGKKEKISVGRCYLKDEEEYVSWNISTPMTDATKLIIGGIITAAVIVAVVLIFTL